MYRRRRLAFLLIIAAVLVAAWAWTRGPNEQARVEGVAQPVSDRSPDAGAAAEGTSGGPLDVLVLGVDRRPPDSREAQVDGTRSDTMMLVRADPGSGEVKLLSIPRDLLVEVGPGVQDRINAAYAYGGVEQAKAAVENATGVTVDRYAVVSFAGFEEVVDAMGGVEMDVEDELPPKYGIEDGPQTLDGRQALYYARFRGTPDADLGRIERQQRLVAALRSEALSWDTVGKLPGIVRVANEHIDTDLGLWQAISLARTLASRGRGTEVSSSRLDGMPETLTNGDEVLVPNQAANESTLKRFRDP